MASTEVVVGPLPMRGWYFVPPLVALALVGALLASALRTWNGERAAPSRAAKAGVANASGLSLMAAGASFVWLFVLGSSRRRTVTLRVDAGTIVVADSGSERRVARESTSDEVSVRKVAQYVDAPPRWCLAYGAANAPLVAFTTFDAKELEPHATALRAALASVAPTV